MLSAIGAILNIPHSYSIKEYIQLMKGKFCSEWLVHFMSQSSWSAMMELVYRMGIIFSEER